MEKTGAKSTSDFRNIIQQLDANKPDIRQVNWSIMERVMEQCDFTNCKDALAAMNLFYQQLWTHVVFPLEDEDHIKQREIGRLIIETDQAQRKAKKLEEEVASLREELQKQSNKEA